MSRITRINSWKARGIEAGKRWVGRVEGCWRHMDILHVGRGGGRQVLAAVVVVVDLVAEGREGVIDVKSVGHSGTW